jgi:RND family efflux transporter MFP subunit
MSVMKMLRGSLAVLVAALGGGCADKHPAVTETPPPVVLVSHPLERTVTDSQVFTARTQAVQSVDVKARVTGYLDEIKFEDGAIVEKGALLFQIDDRPYKATLDQAQAALVAARAALVKAQADYEIGQNVRKGDKGAISEQEIVRRLGARDEAAANVEQAKATLQNAQLNYDWCKVTAPITGRANRHFVDVGNVVTKDTTTLTNIVSQKPTWAYIDVDQNTVLNVQNLVKTGKIKAARDGNVPADLARAVDKGFPFAGYIDFVSNQVDPNTGTLRIRATYPNDKGDLFAGLYARVRIPIGAAHSALLVSDRAVGTNQGQKFIYVVNDKNEVEYRPVDIGQLFDELREVHRFHKFTEPGPDGKDVTREVEVLKPTDRVIVEGLQRVRPEIKVEPKEVNMVTMMRESAAGTEKKPAGAQK